MSYATTQEQLLAELDRIETIIEAHDVDDSPAAAVDPDTADSGESPDPTELSVALPADVRERISAQSETIRQQCDASETRLRLRVLAEVCGLSRRHLDVLLIAMAPVLDSENGKRLQRAHNDRLVSRPTVRYIETLFGRTPSERLAARRLINRNSPLREHGLIDLHAPPNGRSGRANRLLIPSERVIEYLSGDDNIDPELADQLTAHTQQGQGVVDCEADTSLDELAVSDDLREQLATLEARPQASRCYWYGPASEKERAVEAVVDGSSLRANLRAVLRAEALEWLCREVALLGRPLHLYNATDAIAGPETNTSLEAVFDACVDLQTDLIMTGHESWRPTETMVSEVDAILEFPYPSVDLREEFWAAHEAELPDDLESEVLAGTFRLTHDQLQAALSTAHTLSDGELTADDIYAGCSAQSTSQLGELADRIEPEHSWDEIQLRAETERKLRLVRTHITQQARIYVDWGFRERFSRGTGVVALFEGPSGTGKTMAAEILASEVGMDLYRIDLSSVVSKYIGETEEKLEAIFEAATNANAILLFDEADAVFGDRTEVSDSTDRYANAEVNYLLQRIERYDGVVLLTTNYASQIDSAFKRRLNHTVSFKQPQRATRSAIWEEMFPTVAPLGELDYAFLASFEFTGGQIKTIAQTAAILAADDSQPIPTIEMKQLVEAIQLEVEASGRMVDPAAYEPYAHLLYQDENRDDASSCESDATETSSNESNLDHKDNAPSGPESVLELFFERLDSGDPAVSELYHSQAVVDQVSQKELRRLHQQDGSIAGDIERVTDEPSRVRLSCLRSQNGSTTPVTAELRPEAGHWRLFDLRRGESNTVGAIEG